MPHWTIPDLLAEKYFPINTYAYCTGDPVIRIEKYGLYFDDDNIKTANKIRNKTLSLLSRLRKKETKLRIKGGDENIEKADALAERIEQLERSINDIDEMIADTRVEYRYVLIGSKASKEKGINKPETIYKELNYKGDRLVSMFVEADFGVKLHETRHGGQIARREFDIFNKKAVFSAGYEIDAYRAQFAWKGELKYSHYMNENEMLRFVLNAYSPKKVITEIYKINIYLIRSMVDYPGISQQRIYPYY